MSTPVPPDLLDALCLRLNFEREMGLACIRPVPRAQALSGVAPGAARPPESGTPSAAGGLDRNHGAEEEIGKRWRELEARALACTRCALHLGRTKVVFGEGDRRARLVFVGEGPGADEDRTGRPFVGKAGQLLDKIIAAMGLKREEVYICNVVKCRPPENRTPLPDEVGACRPYLEEQLALLAPSVIVALGSPAAKTLLGTSQGIMSLRGRWHLYKGIRVMPTYHPAFVLRQYTQEVRRAVWADMNQVVEFLKSP